MGVGNKKSTWAWGYGMIAPTIIGLIILNIIPSFQTLYYSFFKTGAFGKGSEFVGIDNYTRLVNDPQVWQATWNTIRYTLLVIPPSIIISLTLAILVNNIKGKSIYRTIFFLPMVAAPAAVTMVWRWLYNNQFGLINQLLGYVGIGPVNWIENPTVAIFAVAIIGIWSSIGYNMVLLLAGLQEIPKDYYEAADIDGASMFEKTVKITLPLLSPQLFFVSVTGIISGIQVFDVIYMLINPSMPSYPTTVSLVYLFYNNTFKYSDRGYGSAIVALILVIILILTFIQVKLQNKWVHYMGE